MRCLPVFSFMPKTVNFEMSEDSDADYSDNEFGSDEYYNTGYDCDMDQIDPKKTDPEFFAYECLSVEEVEKLFNESIERLNDALNITPAYAKMLLHEKNWNIHAIMDSFRNECQKYSNLKIKCITNNISVSNRGVVLVQCPVCAGTLSHDRFFRLECDHTFCRECWATFFEIQIYQGNSTQISCMSPNCGILVPEDLVLKLLTRSSLREKYQQFAFQDHVKSHPELRFCPGPNCPIIIRSQDISPKKATCIICHSSFCFQCGNDYHAPTDCHTIKKWITKCADDSETANYISANTKDCPKCQICIEKNGGCNHMQCFNCKQDFCWMCLGDWKSHGSEYYECSRYKENPNIANESIHVQAREALKKYLHYYERWENHSKSLQLEQQTLDQLKKRVHDKVMQGLGTWIDWQYLFNAASLLAKCRYTLQYTYPYAYFMEPGSRKDLFEYQQAQLEAEIENLSWKIERVETNDLGDLQNQMDIAEKRRAILLKDFFPCL